MYNFFSSNKRITISAMVISLYVVTMYMTQSFAFGAYQVRIATALYALAYIYPFLVVPLGIANLLSNFFFGGLGPLDIIGGTLVGMTTGYLISLVARYNLNTWLSALPIWLVPSLGVSLWLSYLLNIPYGVLVSSLSIGQIPPAIVGVFLIHALQHVYVPGRANS